MPDPINVYFQNAQISMAAYADLNVNMTGAQYKAALMAGNRFTESSAREFAGLDDNDQFILRGPKGQVLQSHIWEMPG